MDDHAGYEHRHQQVEGGAVQVQSAASGDCLPPGSREDWQEDGSVRSTQVFIIINMGECLEYWLGRVNKL